MEQKTLTRTKQPNQKKSRTVAKIFGSRLLSKISLTLMLAATFIFSFGFSLRAGSTGNINWSAHWTGMPGVTQAKAAADQSSRALLPNVGESNFGQNYSDVTHITAQNLANQNVSGPISPIDKTKQILANFRLNLSGTAGSRAGSTTDEPGGSSKGQSIQGQADVTAPTSPVSLRAFPATMTASDRFTVFWDNPTDPSGIAAARYKFDTPPTSPTDGTRVAPVNDPTDTTKGLIEDFSTGGRTTKTMYVWLEDGVGNIDHTTNASIILRPEGTAEDLLRVAGADRYETAAKISQKIFPVDHTASAVVVANGTRMADALAAVPLAFRANAPILLSKYNEIPYLSWKELLRVLPSGKTIYVAGGTAVISSSLETYFKNHGFVVKRLAGPSREVTSVKLTEELDTVRGTAPTSVYIANSRTLIDALTVGSPAAFQGRGILLTEPGDLTQNLRDYLNNNRTTISEVTLMGGTAAIPSSVATLLSNAGYVVKRANGSDRYHTARTVADWFVGGTPASPAGVALVSNDGQIDALSAAVHAAAQYYPIILVRKNAKDFECLNTADYLRDHAASIEGGYVYGGGNVLSGGTEQEAEQMISGKLNLPCGN